VELPRGVAHVLRRAGSYDLLHVHGEVAAGLCLPRLVRSRSIVTLHGLISSVGLPGLAGGQRC